MSGSTTLMETGTGRTFIIYFFFFYLFKDTDCLLATTLYNCLPEVFWLLIIFLFYAVYSAKSLQCVVNLERLLSSKRGLVRDVRAEYLDGFISSIWVVRFVKFDTMTDRSFICPDMKSHTSYVSLL